MPNHLKDALSPYLLQHKDNPVDWYQWGEAAFAEAKRRDVPIFLSIGYSTCHWCHVMAHECFEDSEIAKYLNDHFVAIKVDREERPDIDHIYMDALTRMAGQGGWPLNIFLTPDQKPFFGGTYFPPEPRHSLASFPQILQSITQLWKSERERIVTASNEMVSLLQKTINKSNDNQLTLDSLIHVDAYTISLIDNIEGGLRGAPKFPQIPLWRWLFTIAVLNSDNALLSSCQLTAEKLCLGGIYDHIGGGWMRYSTDAKWLAPHFEKMLYDNAQIIYWLSEIHAFAPNAVYIERITQTIDWLQREMLLPEGAFASALDADSEGVEGKYYVWTADEIDKILGEDAELYKKAYDISAAGNWEGMNIPHLNHALGNLVNEKMALLSKKLLDVRQQRIPPSRDDKILLDWNALMIAALTKAGENLLRPEWIDLAETIFQNLEKLLFRDDQWYHAYRNGKHEHLALLDDYAFIIFAVIHLYSATGKRDYLEKAEQWLQIVEQQFTNENRVYNQISKQSEQLIVNPQPLLDGALPSSNGVMAINHAFVWLINGKDIYYQRALELIQSAKSIISSKVMIHFCSFGLAYALLTSGATIKMNCQQNKKWREILFSHLPPFALPLQSTIQAVEICQQQHCLPPLKDEVGLLEALKGLIPQNRL